MSHLSRAKLLSLGVILSCTAALLSGCAGEPTTHAGDGPAVRPSIQIVEDPALDVQQPAEANTERYVGAPNRAIGDISRVRISHGQHRVRIQIRAQRLTRPRGKGYEAVFVGAHLRTPHDSFTVYLTLENQGTGHLLFARKGQEPSRCRGTRRDFETQRGVFTVSIPRTCLDHPRWVRTAATLAYSWPGGGDGDFYIDMAPDSAVYSADPTFSPPAWHPGS